MPTVKFRPQPRISFRKGGTPPVRPGIFANGYRVANWPRDEDPTEEQVAAIMQAWHTMHATRRIKRPLSDNQVRFVLAALEHRDSLRRLAEGTCSSSSQ